MAAKTNFEEALWLEYRFKGGAAPGALTNAYIGLFTLTPGETGGGTEVSGNNYARLAMAQADWDAVVAGEPSTIANVAQKLFAQATGGAWGTVVAAGIFDASTGGNMIRYGALASSKTINDGDNAKFNAGALVVGESEMPIDPALPTRTLASTAEEHLDDHDAIREYLNAEQTPTFVGCKVTKSSDQFIASNTETAVTFDQETFDTSGMHDNATNNTRLTVPTGKGGYWQIVINGGWDNTQDPRIGYKINGGTVRWLARDSDDRTYALSGTDIVSLSATDYVEMFVYHTNGGGANLKAAMDDGKSFFAMHYLGV